MEVALTFGSLGDIIQLCHIAIQLGRAIGIGCEAVGTSPKEYQGLRDELDTFVKILLQVVATYQQHEYSPYLEVLDHESKSIVHRCASLVQEALDHLRLRYQNSLQVGGSGAKVKDMCKKFEWAFREKERIQRLRERLNEGIQRLSLLAALAAEKSARVNNSTLLARIDEVQQTVANKLCNSHQQVLELLGALRKEDKKEANGRELVDLGQNAVSGILEVKSLLNELSHNVVNSQISASNRASFRSLDPTSELPVILEDALGRQLPIPSQFIDSIEWPVLQGLLAGCFKGYKGHDMVMRREFVLEESASGKDLNHSRPLYSSLRRGMKINMSMIFETAEIIDGVCPGCHTVTDAIEDVNVQCPRTYCAMWFRVQKAIIPASDVNKESKNSCEFFSRASTAVTSISVEPGDFQRVRLILLNETDSEYESIEDYDYNSEVSQKSQQENIFDSAGEEQQTAVDIDVFGTPILHDQEDEYMQQALRISAQEAEVSAPAQESGLLVGSASRLAAEWLMDRRRPIDSEPVNRSARIPKISVDPMGFGNGHEHILFAYKKSLEESLALEARNRAAERRLKEMEKAVRVKAD